MQFKDLQKYLISSYPRLIRMVEFSHLLRKSVSYNHLMDTHGTKQEFFQSHPLSSKLHMIPWKTSKHGDPEGISYQPSTDCDTLNSRQLRESTALEIKRSKNLGEGEKEEEGRGGRGGEEEEEEEKKEKTDRQTDRPDRICP